MILLVVRSTGDRMSRGWRSGTWRTVLTLSVGALGTFIEAVTLRVLVWVQPGSPRVEAVLRAGAKSWLVPTSVRLRVVITEPIATVGMSRADTVRLRDEVQAVIAATHRPLCGVHA
ncbi:hypothetical protein LI90_782 [Carbonactinospora thermoautotrophica]|uniref:Uncharacterized protein n=1 Tax=Carbonactinospora thermoautotrophica TaxID=1469144 RepID=A0A132MMS0_9ACTN|nr:hypothetical protein LI90_782 [Carbonactinospora thermoautotrophica]